MLLAQVSIHSNFWKIYWGIIAWLVLYFIFFVYGLQYVISISESAPLYAILLALYFAPLFVLNILSLWYLIRALLGKGEGVWKGLGGLLATSLADLFSFGVFLFITFTVYGFGP